jgi:hypothetical protein
VEILAAKRDRSTVMFAEILVPRLQINLQGNDGIGSTMQYLC